MQYFHYVLVTNQHNDQLTTVGLLAQLLEHYTGIAEIMGPILVQPIFFIFFGWIFVTALKVFLTAMIVFIY